RLRQKEAELKRESVGKLQQFLSESRKTLENLVRELKEGEVNREKTLKVKQFLNELARNTETESALLAEEEYALREDALKESALREDTLSEYYLKQRLLQNKVKNPAEAGTNTDFVFSPGMEVFAGASKQRGTLIRIDKKNSRLGNTRPNIPNPSWLVKVGSLKISFPENELTPAAPVKTKARPSWTAECGSSASAVFELKLIGMRLEEATEALRSQIEAASLGGLKNFSIIHGKGSGILQKGVHEYLKKDPAVADYWFSHPELGGFGRTEVTLK
ncbi:MAG: Smr/MutS family protein, partial [Treponema sp.]|nr:Smr/MutS family protein [Treponema sp.]